MIYKDISRTDNSLRLYQQRAKEDIFSAWDECDGVMFQMPTGTGKTRLFSSIIRDIKTWSTQKDENIKILIIAHRIELIDQISDSLNRYKVSHGIIAGGKPRDLRHSVQIASVQTITHRTNLDVAYDLNANFIIVDEAHHCVANSYKKLWDMYPNAKKLGVTATPWRMNNGGFTSVFNKIIISQSIQSFIDAGWLAPYDYYSISHDSEIQKEINSITEFDIEGDYKTSALEKKIDTPRIRAQLLDSYLKYAKGKKGIIYSISRKHSDHICMEYREAGINIVRIDSKTSKDERKLYVDRFKNGLIDIIVNVDIFSEGFDCPDIEFIQLARPTKSLVKYLQQVGRGLRPTTGKDNCLILDNVGLHFQFGLPNSDRNWEGYFVGNPHVSIHRNDSGRSILLEHKERNYSEGKDEMQLIVASKRTEEAKTKQWSEKDIELLITLFEEKQCPIEILASIFKRSEDEIRNKIMEFSSHSGLSFQP